MGNLRATKEAGDIHEGDRGARQSDQKRSVVGGKRSPKLTIHKCHQQRSHESMNSGKNSYSNNYGKNGEP